MDVKWKDVHVGDVILMEDGQFVAADVLLLSTSEPSGLCFIETAELDGYRFSIILVSNLYTSIHDFIIILYITQQIVENIFFFFLSIFVRSETNLKCRQCLAEVAELAHEVANFDGFIRCETPNNLLNKFHGILKWNNKE